MKGKKILLPAAGLALGLSLTSCEVKQAAPKYEEKIVLTELLISSYNAKTNYVIGEEFSKDNLTVTAVYSDNTKKAITNYNVDTNLFDKSVAGTYKIYISYQEGTNYKVSSYDVTVKSIVESQDVYLLGITAEGMKREYQTGQELDTSNLKVYANYSDLTSVDITDEVNKDFSAFDNTKKGEYELKFSYSKTYNSGSASQTKVAETFVLVTVDAKPISVAFESGTTSFNVDTTTSQAAETVAMSMIDTSDWKFKVTYRTGQTEIVDISEMELDPTATRQQDGSYKVSAKFSHNGVTTPGSVTFNAKFNNITAATKYLDTASLTTGSFEGKEVQLAEGFSLVAASKAMKVSANKATLGSVEFTTRISTEGKVVRDGDGNVSSQAIKFSTTKEADVVVYARSGSSELRSIIFGNAKADISSVEIGSTLTRIVFHASAANDYYLYSKSGNVWFYYIGIFE